MNPLGKVVMKLQTPMYGWDYKGNIENNAKN